MDIAAWLRNLVGLERYEQAFRDNEITFSGRRPRLPGLLTLATPWI
jgi:SAM domain (Sterile alpha motif)